MKVSFFNSLGQQVASEQIQPNGGSFLKEFDWSQFPKGIYEVRIQTEDNKVVITKMVLQ